MDECKPLLEGDNICAGKKLLHSDAAGTDEYFANVECMVSGRGLHSFTFQLNVSAFCGTGGAFRGCLGGV